MTADSDFFRAFVAVRYLLGTRGDALLGHVPVSAGAAQTLVTRLGAEDRRERANVLAAELERMARSLERGKLRA